MAETRRRFGPEFRAGAFRIMREAGKSIARVARDLGINSGTQANWVQQDRAARGEAAAGQLAEDVCFWAVPGGSGTTGRSGHAGPSHVWRMVFEQQARKRERP